MKKNVAIALFLLLCGLLAYQENLDQIEKQASSASNIYTFFKKDENQNHYIKTADYFIDAELNVEEKLLSVNEKVIWINTTQESTNELWFHLYPNGYKSNNTLFSKRYQINDDTKTCINFKSVRINSVPSKLDYVALEPEFPNDSTVAKIELREFITPQDSIVIEFNYEMKIPRSIKRLGSASGREFYFISQWYPKLGAFEKGQWVCSPFYANTNFYSDFADYSVKISVPKNYNVGSTGLANKVTTRDNLQQYEIIQNGVHDFAWFASSNILECQKIITRSDSSTFLLKLFLQPENDEYAERYFKAIQNAIGFCEEYFGPYPYASLTCTDVPRTSGAGGMEYPTLFTVWTELFSREATLSLEELAVHEFVHQYFQGIVANNEVYYAWLDEGITTYLTTRIISEYYGTPFVTFKFLDYLNVEGINFLSYNEIPLIYTMGDYLHPEGYNSYYTYYRSNKIGAIADSSYKLPTVFSYYVNSYNKPEIMFLSLERMIGKEKFLTMIGNYCKKYKFKHPEPNNLIAEIANSCQKDLGWFFKSCYESDSYFDYAITSVYNQNDNKYTVVAERLGDGVFQNDVALYTDSDTLYTRWDGKERWKQFTFETDNEVLGAEIDPQGINRFDVNFANNSYTVEKRYWASLSFSLRWFFWVQNALLILGSIG